MRRGARLLATALVAAAAGGAVLLYERRGDERSLPEPVAAEVDRSPPILVAPEDRLALPPGPAPFVVSFRLQGYLHVQYATDRSFDEEHRVCDSGWYASGFHTESSWTLPGTIGLSSASCRLGPGPYYWRARWAPGAAGGGAPPDASSPSSDWSEPASFLVQEQQAPPPAGWHHKGAKKS